MNRKVLAIAVALVMIAIGLGIHFVSSLKPEPEISVFSADAYLQESNTLLSAFQNRTGTPHLPVKSGGSFDMAREIGQGETSTNFISVSLSSYNQSYLGSHYSGWAVAFASDHMALAYAPASVSTPTENQIISDLRTGYATNNTTLLNAGYTLLTSGKVKVGISDPLSDPAGYRAWISLEIAGKLFANNQSYYMDRLISNRGNRTASSAAELVSPLVSGNIQFLFIYKSAAIAKNIGYVNLSSYTGLGNTSLALFYSGFSLNYSGTIFTGKPIYLFISNPSGEPYQGIAENFTTFVITHSSLLSPYGLKPLSHGILFNSTRPPQFISDMVANGDISEGGPI